MLSSSPQTFQSPHVPTAPSPAPSSSHLTGWRPLNASEINDIESFLFFVGWPRSCHSIIGSMLDANPNIIVAHEYFLFKNLHKNIDRERWFNELYKKSYDSTQGGWRSANRSNKGYTLDIDGSWQGQFTKLKVIGDKSGGDAVIEYNKNPKLFKTFYNRLLAKVKLPVKVIQVIRNPYDMIATATLFEASSVNGVKEPATPTHKYSNFRLLNSRISNFLSLSRALMQMLSYFNLSPHQVYCEDLIADPIGTISSICQYLEVDCSADYLQMCADKTFKNTSVSRDLVEWDPKALQSLTQHIKQFPFFDRYAN